MPGVWDALSARLAAEAGFDVMLRPELRTNLMQTDTRAPAGTGRRFAGYGLQHAFRNPKLLHLSLANSP